MDEQPEVIQQQMEETRSALVQKLEALEGQVAETVQSASDAVQSTTTAVSDTVETVKETVENVSDKMQETMATVTDKVHQTVQSVSEAFDLRLQAERHPWLVVGGAVAVGYVGACLLDQLSNRHSRPVAPPETASKPPRFSNALNGAAEPQPEAHTNGRQPAAQTPDWLWSALDGLRGLAVSSLMGVVRDLALEAIPGAIGDRLAKEVDSITTKLGGEPIAGPVLPDAASGASHTEDSEHKDGGDSWRRSEKLVGAN
jgi:ElaB/YqjD/DUF883 family membrane-anchored ribosome-binding protein